MEVNEARSRCGVIEERRKRGNMWRQRRRNSYLMASVAELPLLACRRSLRPLWTEGETRRRGYWAGLEDTFTDHRQYSVRANSRPCPKKAIHDLAQQYSIWP
jgi:hypothetical protein